MLGIVIWLLVSINTLKTQLYESRESNNILRSINLKLTDENIKITDENAKCTKDLETLIKAGKLIGGWKQRTEKIMWNLDNLFMKYDKAVENYCMIYNSERKYWDIEMDKIVEEYENNLKDYEDLISEQK